MECLFVGGTGCCQEDSSKGREASTWQTHLQGLPGFHLVQVLHLAKQGRKFKPSALKCKREGVRPGQNPIAGAGRHLCTPNPSVHPRCPAQEHPLATRGQRDAVVPAALPSPPSTSARQNFRLSGLQLWSVIHAVALQRHRKLPGGMTRPPPLSPSVISADGRGEPP